MQLDSGDRPESNENLNPEVGRKVKAHRKRLGLNQTEYGKRYGVGQIAVSNWERGVSTPDRDHMEELKADFLEVEDEGTRQFALPFERTFVVELRIGPQSAGSVNVKLHLKKLAN